MQGTKLGTIQQYGGLEMKPILPTPNSYLRERQVLNIIPINRSTLWRWVKDGSFPSPIKLSAGVTVWNCNQVYAWISDENGGVR